MSDKLETTFLTDEKKKTLNGLDACYHGGESIQGTFIHQIFCLGLVFL